MQKIIRLLLVVGAPVLLGSFFGCDNLSKPPTSTAIVENPPIHNSLTQASAPAKVAQEPELEPFFDPIPVPLALPLIDPGPLFFGPPAIRVVHSELSDEDDDGSLIIVKKIKNDDGGTSSAAAFGVTITPGRPVRFDHVETSGTTTTYRSEKLELDAGDYSLRERNVYNYSEGEWTCTNGDGGSFNRGLVSITKGDLVTCTITNDDIKVVGYYEMCEGEGVPAQVPPIRTALLGPLKLTNVLAEDLAGIDVLFVDNCNNDGYSDEYLAALPDIQAWVNEGGRLVIHDRFVDSAETILPGGGLFDIQRNLDDDASIDILDNTTLVTNGPGGILTNSSLDGGTSSSHGFAVMGSLPSTGRLILSRTDPSEIVTFSYCFGAGGVVYSSIPLDYYLEGQGPPEVFDNIRLIYAPNIIAYTQGSLLCN